MCSVLSTSPAVVYSFLRSSNKQANKKKDTPSQPSRIYQGDKKNGNNNNCNCKIMYSLCVISPARIGVYNIAHYDRSDKTVPVDRA